MRDDAEPLMWLFMVLVGLSLLIAVSALAAVVWFVISTIGMKMRKDYLAKKARESIEEGFEREGTDVPIDDLFAAYGAAGVVIDDEDVDEDDMLGGILLGMGRSIHDGRDS